MARQGRCPCPACRSACWRCRDQSPDRLKSSCAKNRTFKILSRWEPCLASSAKGRQRKNNDSLQRTHLVAQLQDCEEIYRRMQANQARPFLKKTVTRNRPLV